MLRLFSADACPYAQRSRAMLAHLEVPFELVTIDLRQKPAEFLALSPTGKVPMLVDGENRLYESYVIDEYLAERQGWSGAYARDAFQRARERLAMLQFDQVVVPAFWDAVRGRLSPERRQAAERELDELDRTAAGREALPNLLAFHVVTHVVRWRWLGDSTPLPAMLEARPALARWLDEVAALPAVQATLPAREATVAQLRALASRG